MCVCVCVCACADVEDLGFKDTELEMFAASLKELSPTRELILSLEQLLSDDVSPLEERNQVTCTN